MSIGVTRKIKKFIYATINNIEIHIYESFFIALNNEICPVQHGQSLVVPR